MLARIAYSTYFGGIVAGGLFGTYLSAKDFENQKKIEQEADPDIVEPQISEFIRYSGRCGIGFTIGLLSGLMWPVAMVGKTISVIDKLDIITKNN
jgi:hypothetical protein